HREAGAFANVRTRGTLANFKFQCGFGFDIRYDNSRRLRANVKSTALAASEKPKWNGDLMAADIRTFPCLNDNFGHLIHDPATKATASIDAPESGPIIKALEREGWKLTDILITHHHGDHVGGV